MTLALYGKSRQRQQALIFAAFVAVLAAAMLGTSIWQAERASADAVYTSIQDITPTSTCENGGGNGVNCNQYAAKTSVYLNGGPSSDFLDDNWYCFSVYNTSQQVLLSTDLASERIFQVSGGEILYSGSHSTGSDSRTADVEVTIGFAPFNDSANGVYKYALYEYASAPDGSGAECPSTTPPLTKTDNFSIAGVVPATIVLDKTNDSTGTELPGATVSYTITLDITNGPLSEVIVEDVLPTGIGAATNISDGGTYNAGTNTITWNLATATDGDTLTYDAVIAADATPGTKTNTATATHTACSEDGSDCSDTSTVEVGAVAPAGTVEIDKTHADLPSGDPGDGQYNLGETFTFTITFEVIGGATEGDLNWNDPMPDGLTILGVNMGANPGNMLNCGFDAGQNTVFCFLPDDTPEGTYETIVMVTVDNGAACGPVTNHVLTGAISGEGTSVANDTISIAGCGGLTHEKSDSTQVQMNGTVATITWTIAIHNSSAVPQDAFIVDAGATVVGSTGCDPAASLVSGVISCLDVPAGAAGGLPEATITLTTTYELLGDEICEGETVQNIAYLVDSSTETTPGADDPGSTASANIPPVADVSCISVAKELSDTTEPPTWTIEITNTGGAATDVFVVDPEAASHTVLSGGTCGAGDIATGIACTVDANSTLRISVTKAIPLPATCEGHRVDNTVNVWVGTFTSVPTSPVDFAIEAEPHEGISADPELCGATIQLCKAWRLDVEGEVPDAAAANFHFNVSDTEEPSPGEIVTIGAVAEDGEVECVLIDVVPGTIIIAELPAPGFVLDGWNFAPGDAPDDSFPTDGTGSATFTVTSQGCFFSTSVPLVGVLDLVGEIQAIVVPGTGTPLCTFTFVNHDEQDRLPSGDLRIEKYLDINGDGDANDPGEGLLDGWDMTIAGDDVNEITPTGDGAHPTGTLVYSGLESGDIYVVTEETRAGWTVTNATVDGSSVGATTTATATIPDGGTTVVRFYNTQLGSIPVHKDAFTRHNFGPDVYSPEDDDGWTIRVTSDDCDIEVEGVTNAAGDVIFHNLPLCTDYVVAEVGPNAASPGFVQVAPAGPYTNVTPGGGQTLTFVNRKDTSDPPCTNCTPVTITPSPTNTPTPTPTTPTVPPTTPPTNTPTNTPVTQIAGEQTPGPGSTPVAPSAGNTAGGLGSGVNVLLLVAALVSLCGGFATVALARRAGR